MELRWLLLAALFPAVASGGTLTWGMESWTCGTAEFRVTVGSGVDIHLYSISGAVTAQASAPPDGGSRQSLMAVFPGVPLNTPHSIVSTSPDVNHSLDEHLVGVNMKQMGSGATPPVSVQATFNPPQLIRNGDLRAVIFTANYSTADTIHCLNTEAQLTITYKSLP